MRAIGTIAVIAMLLVLAGCGSKISAQPLKTPTAAVSSPVPEPQAAPAVVQDDSETGTTAAEALRELSENDIDVSGVKSATSLYPDIQVEGSDTDKLKAKTRALYSQSLPLSEAVDADKEFGPRYADGDLPPGYGDDGSAGE